MAGHRNLLQLRLAFGLALMHGLAEVDDENWVRAGYLIMVSTQSFLILEQELYAATQAKWKAQGKAKAVIDGVAQDQTEDKMVGQALNLILARIDNHLERHNRGGCTKRCFKDACGSRHRAFLDLALVKGVEVGALSCDASRHWTRSTNR